MHFYLFLQLILITCTTRFAVFENLTDLQELDLSSNQLTGNLPASFFTLPRIQHLNVSQNLFEGSIPMSSNLNHSSSFRTVNISMNNLSGNFSFHWLRNMANLEKIDFSGNIHLAVGVNFPGWKPPFQLKELLLSGCDIDKSIFTEPHFLHTQNHLETLDLSNSSLPGSFPSWLFVQQPALLYLNLGSNLLSGSLDQITYTQTSLLAISLSLNRISGRLPANISSIFPNATFLDFSGNTISGEIPPDLCNISNMEYLDLSNNNLQGELPSCLFADHPILKTLKVSNNKLGGPILGGKSHMSIRWEIYLDGNNFEGELPRHLTGGFVDGGTLDFHGNKLSGKLDVMLWSLPNLWTLNLGSNNLTGEIDQSICGLTGIILLDISNNSISGSLPNCSNPLSLLFLNMSANQLSGDIAPYSFFSNATVTALDLSYNQFTGSIDWVQTLGEVRYLSLGTNKFEGQIPQTICQLQYVRVIDLSHNRLSGSLPACIGDFPFEGKSSGLLYWNLLCGRGFQYPGFSLQVHQLLRAEGIPVRHQVEPLHLPAKLHRFLLRLRLLREHAVRRNPPGAGPPEPFEGPQPVPQLPGRTDPGGPGKHDRRRELGPVPQPAERGHTAADLPSNVAGRVLRGVQQLVRVRAGRRPARLVRRDELRREQGP